MSNYGTISFWRGYRDQQRLSSFQCGLPTLMVEGVGAPQSPKAHQQTFAIPEVSLYKEITGKMPTSAESNQLSAPPDHNWPCLVTCCSEN